MKTRHTEFIMITQCSVSMVHVQKGVVGTDPRTAESITKKLVVTATSAVSCIWLGRWGCGGEEVYF